MTACGLESV